ncbi:carbohydrate ABC transporter permease [Arthrobacter sp. Rue61a]|uniref:carbohydrate ABC transporter permease n=1 Tax=Arthrobacter sp. Rue61a TaxID=1118963 RepID=UPI00027DFE54|nr:carbohydrate ABC transporter permease [Arthrobacter sp. Rue61a]AFR28831.1 putative ABC transporter permease protein YesQ [Arthrobacter sp. Rue61a]
MTFVAIAPPAQPDPLTAASVTARADGSKARNIPRWVAWSAAPSHALLLVLAAASIFPVYWMFVTAFRPAADSLSTNPFPVPFSLENFEYVVETLPIVGMMANTFGMALVLAVCQLLVAILASYGFARWNFVGKKALYLLFVGSWLVPFQVTMIPNYLLVSQMGLLNTITGVVLPQLCSAFAVMMLRQHLEAFPKDLLDASQMDGRSSWRTLWEVVIPNLRPALAALGIMLFISAWNEYLWPSLIMQKSDALIQVGIRGFLGAEGNNWGAVMAASALACLPIFLIYIFLQRYVVDAFVRSGLK